MALDSIGVSFPQETEVVELRRPVRSEAIEPAEAVATMPPAEQARVATEGMSSADELHEAWSEVAGEDAQASPEHSAPDEPVVSDTPVVAAAGTASFSSSSSWRAAASLVYGPESSPAPEIAAQPTASSSIESSAAQARYHEYRLSMPEITEYSQSGDNDFTLTRQPTEAERLAYGASFVDPETGLTGAEIQRMEQSVAESRQATPVATSGYGLNERDRELLADPARADAQARYQAYRDLAPDVMTHWISGDNDGVSLLPPNEAQKDEFAAGFVDLPTAITGADLQHLDRSLVEQRQGDEAARKLEAVNLGSFTGNQDIQAVSADRAFAVIGQDQREALMADGFTTLGKAFVLEDGRMILPDEHETGVYFISKVSANALATGGVIDTGNGGYNIDGLYLDGGNATIGTTRPSGGLFGSLLNNLDHLLPGGKLGELAGDAISDLNKFLNLPLKQGLEAVGADHGFLGQVVGHQEATVDVIAHADETGNETFAEFTRRTAEYDQVDQVAYQVGRALVATGVGTIVGAGIMMVAGANIAGHAQLQGDAEADPNSGIVDAAQTFMLAQAGGALGNSAQAGVSSLATEAGGTLAEFSGELGSAAKNLVTGATNQLGTTGEIDLSTLVTSQLAGMAGAGVEGVAGDFALEAGMSSGTASVLGDLAGGFTQSVVSQAANGGEVDLETALLGAVGEATEFGNTGMNAVQLVQLGEALQTGDSAQVGSLLTSTINGLGAQEPQVSSGGDEELATEFAPDSGVELGPDQETIQVPSTRSDAEVEEILFSGGSGAPLETRVDPRADVFMTENGDFVTMVTDTDGRAQMTARQSSGPGGSTVVTRFGEDGNATGQRTSYPNGVVVDQTEGSSTLAVQTRTQDRAGFEQAFAAARGAGADQFNWNGKLYTTELAPDRPATPVTGPLQDSSTPTTTPTTGATGTTGTAGTARPAGPATDSSVLSSISDTVGRWVSGNPRSLDFFGVVDNARTGLEHPATRDPNVFVVTGHGNSEFIEDQRTLPNIARFVGSLVGQEASSTRIVPVDLAQRIRDSGGWQEGMPVVLLACNVGTGQGAAYAQSVANLLGVPVAGGDGFVGSDSRGSQVSNTLTPDGRIPDGQSRGLTWFTPRPPGG